MVIDGPSTVTVEGRTLSLDDYLVEEGIGEKGQEVLEIFSLDSRAAKSLIKRAMEAKRRHTNGKGFVRDGVLFTRRYTLSEIEEENKRRRGEMTEFSKKRFGVLLNILQSSSKWCRGEDYGPGMPRTSLTPIISNMYAFLAHEGLMIRKRRVIISCTSLQLLLRSRKRKQRFCILSS